MLLSLDLNHSSIGYKGFMISYLFKNKMGSIFKFNVMFQEASGSFYKTKCSESDLMATNVTQRKVPESSPVDPVCLTSVMALSLNQSR